jgi:hypothetical protein
MALTVTFDTNTLASVISPQAAQRDTGMSGAAVRTAIQDGRILGFFCETLVTLEGIETKDRVDILGNTRVISEATSTDRNAITLTVGIRHHHRNPLEPRFQERVQGASAIGMRALMAPARIVGLHVRREDCLLFEPPSGKLELLRCMDRVNEMATKIAEREVGHSVAVRLGLQFSERAGITAPELYLQGLGRAQGKSESKLVAAAIGEWADGDSIAAHFGFGIDLFCSEDYGGNSVLSRDSRNWLIENFNFRFVTLKELAEMVAS